MNETPTDVLRVIIGGTENSAKLITLSGARKLTLQVTVSAPSRPELIAALRRIADEMEAEGG